MRRIVLLVILLSPLPAFAAELESRVLTHDVPTGPAGCSGPDGGLDRDRHRREGGPRKGDMVRLWAGGSIDRGSGDQPGMNVNGPGRCRVATAGTGVDQAGPFPRAGTRLCSCWPRPKTSAHTGLHSPASRWKSS